MRTVLVIVLAALSCLSCARGLDEQPKLAGLELKIYNIHNLVNIVPDYPGPNMSIGAGVVATSGGFAPKAVPLPTAASIADMVRARVRPDSWDPALGTAIEEMGGYLVVMQRPEIHAQIAQLFSAFGAAQKSQVVVKALLIPSAAIPDETFFDEAELNALFDGNAAAAATAAPRIVGFNKRRVYVFSGTVTPAVQGADINDDSLDPVVQSHLSGFVLDVRPTQSYDHAVTDLELRASFNVNSRRNPRTLGASAASGMRAVAVLPQQESSTTTTKKEDGHDEITASSRRPAGLFLNPQYLLGLEMDFPSADSGDLRTEVSVPAGKWVLAGTLNNPDAKSPKKNMLLFVSSETLESK